MTQDLFTKGASSYEVDKESLGHLMDHLKVRLEASRSDLNTCSEAEQTMQEEQDCNESQEVFQELIALALLDKLIDPQAETPRKHTDLRPWHLAVACIATIGVMTVFLLVIRIWFS